MQEKPRSAIMTARLGIRRTIAVAAARKLCGIRAATACFTASPLIKTALCQTRLSFGRSRVSDIGQLYDVTTDDPRFQDLLLRMNLAP